MKPIPNNLECAYCIRSSSHGGECRGKNFPDYRGCLAFKADEKGCIRNKDITIEVPIYGNVPLLNSWNDEWTLDGQDTEVRILKIYGLKWDTKYGYLIIVCNCDLYINEYSDDYEDSSGYSKPILKVIK